MKRSVDRILTSHVGSLVRPESLLPYARAAMAGEPIEERAYADALRGEVRDVVAEQVAHGVDVVSDGEFGKPSWSGYSSDRLTGFELREDPTFLKFLGHDFNRFPEFYEETLQGPMRNVDTSRFLRQLVCVEPIEYTDAGRAAMKRDVDNFIAALRAADVEEGFLPVVAPCSISPSYANEYYKSDEEFLFALADAQHEEYKIIVDAGLIVQVDDAILTNLYDAVVDSGQDYPTANGCR